MLSKIILFIIAVPLFLTSQNKRDYNWQFRGYEMDFTQDPMQPKLRQHHRNWLSANASISTLDGDLLFYSNGCSVFNREHEIMANGDSLNVMSYYEWNPCRGHPSKQDISILPDPGNADGYYIVHHPFDVVNNQGATNYIYNELWYSYVDMTLDDGKGAVTIKNELLFKGELHYSHLTAINHSNGNDWWVTLPTYPDYGFERFLIDENGIRHIGTQSIGPATDSLRSAPPSGFGQSRFSPDGKRYAHLYMPDGLQLYDFDRATGLFSNLRHMEWPQYAAGLISNGSVEFSPNSNFLYLCDHRKIFQFNWSEMLSFDNLQVIDEHNPEYRFDNFAFMRLGPDCSIYVRASSSSFFLSTINKPNERFPACEFELYDIFLPEVSALGGFPNFPRFRVDEVAPCREFQEFTPTNCSLISDDIFCEEWVQYLLNDYGWYNCSERESGEMEIVEKDNIQLVRLTMYRDGNHFRSQYYNCDGSIAGYSYDRVEEMDTFFVHRPDSLAGYVPVRYLGNCDDGYPECLPSTFDCPSIVADIGDACDDGNPETENDVVTDNCECLGEEIFDCPGLMSDIGDACDDGDASTDNDIVNANCICMGVPEYDCPDLMLNHLDACDDGDTTTENDYVTSSCDCIGVTLPISTCPDPLLDIFCEQWLIDTLANLADKCLSPTTNIEVHSLTRGTQTFIMVVENSAPVDYIGGVIYDCEGNRHGTMFFGIWQPPFGYNYEPPVFEEFTRVELGNCADGYPDCVFVDSDGDGFPVAEDCNDSDSSVFPGAEELCNGIDDNCDGLVDEGIAVVRYYFDGDGDGYGVPDPSVVDCSHPSGYVLTFDDCDDTDPTVYPGQTEGPYNGKDDDCDPTTPDDDLDGDGFLLAEDCDDGNPLVNPTAVELCDSMDNNCNNEIDEGLAIIVGYADSDGDGFGSSLDSVSHCAMLPGYVQGNTDCDDSDPDINPAASEVVYNGLDDDCNPATLDDDLDGDGYGLADDCNDNDPLINPTAVELCDGLDNNCNSEIDEGLPLIIGYVDSDGDGYGSALDSVTNCALLLGYVENNEDCDDTDSLINPSAEEMPNNGIDEDCDGADMTDAVSDQSIDEITVFPNPTRGFVKIVYPNNIFFDFRLYNVDGNEISLGKTSDIIDLTAYPVGVYVLVISNYKKRNIVRRIIKI